MQPLRLFAVGRLFLPAPPLATRTATALAAIALPALPAPSIMEEIGNKFF